ncbi:sigma-54 interaction domain-containing protein [Desulfitobacterium chlororespirans]|uniref:Transcriptional regulator containing PAS, AAA-type ATPase, and DNA-binding Fis domains n=1 Tax=Desulfitobacterium chlororespirans DSM 11544 TaxID=1121395 RepID=A0A1M7SXK8_9FIRM|nr:sigma 54-interacting transcriptional regulator [Desulfitobacterium chlororespirans]SHN63253.1 Transcriptional regulator containing PAS, AAA-type ATPase, and DNA-binding Fis domains [Desulfitobacterium chlororespirans DSM 11544]
MKVDSELARLIIEQMDGVAITDKEGRYIYVNDKWVKRMNKQPEEVLGKYVKEIYPQTKIDLVLKTRRPIIGEIFYNNEIEKDPVGIINYLPVFKDNELFAGLIFAIFEDMKVALEFKKKVEHLSRELEYFKEELRKIRGSRYTVDNIIGNSKAVLHLKEQIYQAARSTSTVLIEGETGTGKELVAHAIHDSGQRNVYNFIKINCAAIPEDLLESEFFGYEEGAFTGAKKGGRKGKFEMAHNGSLFLDEVNQMPLVLQPKLLRVLQEKEIERIGGHGSIPVNVRVIAASNVSLERLVQEKKFRSDLFYRLNVVRISIPPLRERKEDIPLLAQELLKRLNFQLGLNVKEISSEVMELLVSYNWPGNIRELQNVLERAMNIAWGEVLEISHFSWFRDHQGGASRNLRKDVVVGESLREKKTQTEKEAVEEALKICQGNKAQAARLLNISRTSFYKKLKKYSLF